MSQKEGRIALAIQAYQNSQFADLKETCSSYDVPYSTVRDRVKGRVLRSNSQPKNKKLTNFEELTLENWILSMSNRGLLVRIYSIEQIANLLLQKRSVTSQENANAVTVGKCWARNFIRRKPTLQTKYIRKYDYQRALCEDPVKLRAWFRLVQNTISKYRIQTSDIYNFDETGFQMSVIATAKVITGSERAGRLIYIQLGNRE